jgi:hypothetical protein
MNRLVLILAALSIFGTSMGCMPPVRSTFDLQTPRFYLWTRFDPDAVRDSIQVNGLSVEEQGGQRGGLFIVRGTGTLKCRGAEITVRENSITVNGVTLPSASNSYETALIKKDGRVRPHVNPPFEWPVYIVW